MLCQQMEIRAHLSGASARGLADITARPPQVTSFIDLYFGLNLIVNVKLDINMSL
jgi:hypothetical protein